MEGCDVCIGYDTGEYTEFWQERTVKARKPHQCCECRADILRGQSYDKTIGKYEGDFFSFETCALCAEIRGVFGCGDGVPYTELWERMRENAFQSLTLSSPCFRELSVAAKEEVLKRWRDWKGLTNSKRDGR